MSVLSTATQFSAGCLTLGLGIFVLSAAVQDLARLGLPAVGTRAVAGLSGALLLGVGGFVALVAVPF